MHFNRSVLQMPDRNMRVRAEYLWWDNRSATKRHAKFVCVCLFVNSERKFNTVAIDISRSLTLFIYQFSATTYSWARKPEHTVQTSCFTAHQKSRQSIHLSQCANRFGAVCSIVPWFYGYRFSATLQKDLVRSVWVSFLCLYWLHYTPKPASLCHVNLKSTI